MQSGDWFGRLRHGVDVALELLPDGAHSLDVGTVCVEVRQDDQGRQKDLLLIRLGPPMEINKLVGQVDAVR